MFSSFIYSDEYYGYFEQGGYILGKTEPGAKIRLQSNNFSADKNGYFLLGFSRNENTGFIFEILKNNNRTDKKDISVEPRTYRTQTVNGVPQKTVTPPPELLRRIHEEAARVYTARHNNHKLSHWLEVFIWPLYGPISGVYGSQRIYNGTPGNPHYGIDIAAPEGTPVYAPAGGIVVLAEPDLFYSGGTLIIDHGAGLSSTLIHLSRVDVKAGAVLEQGEEVGAVGSTGRATGPHLDWRMNWGDVRIDPAYWVPGQESLCHLTGSVKGVLVIGAAPGSLPESDSQTEKCSLGLSAEENAEQVYGRIINALVMMQRSGIKNITVISGGGDSFVLAAMAVTLFNRPYSENMYNNESISGNRPVVELIYPDKKNIHIKNTQRLTDRLNTLYSFNPVIFQRNHYRKIK